MMTIAFWCVLVAAFLPPITGWYAKASRKFDNENPRNYFSNLNGAKARAVAAMENGYEGFPLFAASVIIAYLLNAEQSTIDMLAIGYVVSRVIYGVLYIAGKGTLRSIVWIAGIACVVGIFVVAA